MNPPDSQSLAALLSIAEEIAYPADSREESVSLSDYASRIEALVSEEELGAFRSALHAQRLSVIAVPAPPQQQCGESRTAFAGRRRRYNWGLKALARAKRDFAASAATSLDTAIERVANAQVALAQAKE